MAFLADSQGQLVIRYDNAADFVCFVNVCLDNLCRAQSIGNILCRIFTVFYNINLFTAQLVNDSLYAHALVAYAGTYRINIAVSGIYGNLGAHTGLAGNGFDFNNAVMDFRNLQLKQALQQAGMSTRNHNLRSLVGALNLNNIGFHTLMVLVDFTGNLLVRSQHGFNLAQIDINVLVFHALDNTGNDIIGTALEAFIYLSALCLTDTLYNKLLSVLGSNTAEVFRSNLNLYDIACKILRVDCLSILQSHFVNAVSLAFNYSALSIYMDFTGFFIHFNTDILVCAGVLLVSSNQSVINSLEQKLGVNTLFLS